MGMVSVEDSTRSVASASSGGSELMGANKPIETVSSPNDLTGLGIRITEFLADWEDNDNRTVVCFDSLTALLQYVELETAYEFLHILTGRMAALDAFAHFHMDPDAHDQQTIESISTLMDAVVRTEDGEQIVRTRNI
jgi:archaellum biogenesis ATPase FlaH